MSNVRVFVSFDVEHDRELYDALVAQSRTHGSSFAVSAGTERNAGTDVSSERTRRRIRDADQVIIICGEHTESSVPVSVELGMARQEGIPYFMLWGRRDVMCTKPVGAKPAEGMYSWTRQILLEQIAFIRRRAHSDEVAEPMRAARLKGSSTPSGAAP